MTDVTVDIDKDVFNEIFIPHLNNYARQQIFYGGSASGKSVFLAQRCVYDLLRGDRNYLICREVGRTVKGSVWIEVQRVIRNWNLEQIFDYHIQDRIITCKNGYQAVFTGLDDMEKLKSMIPAKGVFTDVWVEEATEVSKKAIKMLLKRERGGEEDIPKRLTMSFNPILQSHWIYKEYFEDIGWTKDQVKYNGEDLSILKTWYEHNRFLTEDDIQDLENEEDEYYYQVYTLGNWGILGNVIFKNWEVRDLSGMENQWTNRKHGLDFGFASDPAAAPATYYDKKKKTIYIYDELYEKGLTNDILALRIKEMIGQDRVICDSAEPKSIAELRSHGVTATGAIKGKDSVHHGIQWLRQQKIIIDKSCINTRNEFMQYKWKEGKDGNPVSPPTPVDENNHVIDGLRYAYEDEARAVTGDLVTFV